MDPDTVVYKRYVYTIWGFFGEVFGLQSIVNTVIAGPLIAFGLIFSLLIHSLTFEISPCQLFIVIN